MKFVKQTRFYHDDGRGNCVAAAIASIFELDVDDVDVPDGTGSDMVATWTNNNFPHLDCWNVDHGKDYREIEKATGDEWGRWEYDLPDEFEPPTQELWMATVVSPSGILLAGGPYRGSPVLHAVVMEGADVVHDPNPNYGWTTNPVVVQSTWWTTKP